MALAAHLQTCHSLLWRQATPIMNFLTDTVLRWNGCMCLPSTRMPLSSHVCTGLKQLSMLFMRMEADLLIPYQFRPEILNAALSEALPAAIRDVIIQCLLDRDFQTLWTQPDIIHTLRHTCFLCGRTMHPADLCLHLYQDRACGQGFETHIVTQLIEIYTQLQSLTHTCHACTLAFTAPATLDPDEFRTVFKTHFKGQCPVIQQTALILACHEPVLSTDGPGRANAAGGSISGPGPDPPGQQSEAEPACSQKTSRRPPTRQGSKRKSSRPPSSSSRTGLNRDQVGQGSERCARARFICLLNDAGARGHVAHADSTSPALEKSEAGSQESPALPENLPVQDYDTGASNEGPQSCKGGSIRCPSRESDPTADHDGRLQLALYQKWCPVKKCLLLLDKPALTTTKVDQISSGKLDGGSCGGQVPLLASDGHPVQGGAMESQAPFALFGAMAKLENAATECSMATLGLHHEIPYDSIDQTMPESPRDAASATASLQGQRQGPQMNAAVTQNGLECV